MTSRFGRFKRYYAVLELLVCFQIGSYRSGGAKVFPDRNQPAREAQLRKSRNSKAVDCGV